GRREGYTADRVETEQVSKGEREMHASEMSRRTFLGVGLAAGAVGLAGAAAPESGRFKKAVKYGMVRVEGSILDRFRLLRELGFDGVELDAPSNLDKKEVLKARDATGLEIPGVVDSAHWRQTLSHPDPEVRRQGVEAL